MDMNPTVRFSTLPPGGAGVKRTQTAGKPQATGTYASMTTGTIIGRRRVRSLTKRPAARRT